MRMINPILFLKDRFTSLFLRLLSGFLCIILLLCSLTLYSFTVSKQNVREEIVKYNTLMLHHTMDSYEKHFDMIKKQMMVYFLSERVQKVRTDPNYLDFPIILQELGTWVSNAQLYIHNIMLYSKSNELIVEKGSSSKADTMFNVFYRSAAYGPEFWRKQFDENYSFRVLPAATFDNHMYRDQMSSFGELIPVVIKTIANNDFLMIVFLDAAKMYGAFHRSAGDDFLIRDQTGQQLFRNGGQDPPIEPEELYGRVEPEFVSQGKYYFQASGGESGLTYAERIPIERISSQTRLKITLVAATILSVAASIIISWIIAAGINSPLQKVLRAIRGEGDAAAFRSSIREFNILRHQIQDKNRTDKQLAILQQLKAIRTTGEAKPFSFAGKPFVLVLFQAMSRAEEDAEQGTFAAWLSYMKAVMEDKLAQLYPGAMTFHTEKNQILGLVFTDQRDELLGHLVLMETLFEQDKAFGTVTIAVSSMHEDSNRIAEAYQEALNLVRERKMTDRTQILSERAAAEEAIGFAPDQWKEFQVNLREGNEAQLTALIERIFARRQAKETGAAAWLEFGAGLIAKIKSEASPLVIAPGRLSAIFLQAEDRMHRCITTEELERLLIGWTSEAAAAFREKKEQRDPITSFVLQYVNEHLAEEIYLDVLAERLNLSGGYLSSYFKEKTGMNIVDFINETRIMKATSLLADSKYKIQDVSEAVGYRNITSFNRMFKKYIGLTPSEFRRKPSQEV